MTDQEKRGGHNGREARTDKSKKRGKERTMEGEEAITSSGPGKGKINRLEKKEK